MTQPRIPIAKLLLLFTALLTLTGTLSAATINVPGDSATIQAAIADAGTVNGDEIVVAAGTYVENIDFLGKAITLRSASGDPADTIIDGGGSGRAVTCDSGETSATVLDGFTITDGSANYGGGGMHNDSSSPTVIHCTFSGNTGTYGGGMYNWDSSPTVSNCTFSGNTATRGGGMGNGNASSPTVSNCTFSGNTANAGGGMMNDNSSSPTVTNSVLWGNSAGSGNETYNFDVLSAFTVTYSCIQGGYAGDGNIDSDPLFVDADGPDDDPETWQDNNFRLSPGSPCIDVGNNAAIPAGVVTDIDGNPRIVNGVVDMGAYESVVPLNDECYDSIPVNMNEVYFD